jgi:hypothetical protein
MLGSQNSKKKQSRKESCCEDVAFSFVVVETIPENPEFSPKNEICCSDQI